MTRLRALLLVAALCILLPALALPPQTPAPLKTTPPPAAPEAKTSPTTPSPVAHPLEKADLEAFFDGLVPIQMERSDVAGATILVMKDGQEILKKGYGYSDLTKKTPVDPDTTMFRLASISKLFTWVSVMQLAEQGKLDIDADVNNYLDFKIAPAFGKPITLRNLMTHTGGFEEVVHDILFVDPKKATSLRDFLINNQPRRMYPPGEIPAYSNYGVGLAGYIVQRISLEPFEQYVSEHIFQPLGMKHSSFNQPMTAELAPNVSDGYRATTEKPAIGFEIFQPAPAGGVSSTAGDMKRFALALLNGGELDGQRILKTETRDAMWTRQFDTNDALPPMCMGFYQTWRNDLRFIGHDGDLVAFHSMFLMEPTQKLVVFVSYNSAGSSGRNRAELLDGFADRYFPAYTSMPFQSFPVDQLKDIAGNYQSTRRADSTKLAISNPAGQGVASVDKDGVLSVDVYKDLRGHTRKWKPVGKDLWQIEGEQGRLFAIRDSSGKITRLAVSFPGVQFQRVPWYEHKTFVGIGVARERDHLARGSHRQPASPGPKALLPQSSASYASTRHCTDHCRSTFGRVLLDLGSCVDCLALSVHLQNEALPSFPTLVRYFWLINWFSVAAVFFSIFALVAGIRIWRRTDVRVISRVKFSLVAVACVFLTWYSIHWSLIGPVHRF